MTITGLDALKQAQEREAKKSNYSMFLFLRDGDVARVRFMTNGAEIQTQQYHTVPTGRQSKSGKALIEDVYCGWEDGQDCRYCGNVSQETQRSRKMNMFVWVYEVEHADGNVDAIHAPRVWRIGGGKAGYITNFLTTYVKKYGSLTDRDYEIRRTGAGMVDTTYNILPEDKGPVSDEQKAAVSKLPDLEALSKGEDVEWSWSVKREQQKEEKTVPNNSNVRRPTPPAGGKSLLEKLRDKEGKPKSDIGESI